MDRDIKISSSGLVTYFVIPLAAKNKFQSKQYDLELYIKLPCTCILNIHTNAHTQFFFTEVELHDEMHNKKRKWHATFHV